MNTVPNNGMTVSGRFLGTACFAAILPQSLLSEALKDIAGISSVARTAVLLHKQSGYPRRG
ncbi:MAG: hypothetical protein V4671_21305 [Armatimonadota bacterium]